MLDFRPICLEDRAWIEPVMQAAAGHGSEFSFVNLYLWGDQRVASVDGTPVFLSNFSGSLTYPWPVGCRDLPGTLELLRQDACERGIPLRLFGLLGREEDTAIPWGDIEKIGTDVLLVRTAVSAPPRSRKKLFGVK